ncbi:DUF4097 domain-containing protein [Antribacter sp. KLBMP9083]|uniref:DUF4097 domain-containing protein n=1 Tax=Antribacter soli TaxID=2910976 RepID=A0AA41QB59_9MICO|nr:DUF4097 family beta strand repeat-containing protein [Antribacter soli]MCF4119891.1 DUF4097 domain-containing protein [Antribacter soli]
MHTFNTHTPIRAVVDVPGGQVRFIAADRTDATIEIRPADAAKGRDVKAAERTTVEFREGTLQVATPTKHEAFGPSGSVEVTVQLPVGSSVEVTGVAELRGVGRFGDVVANSSYGAIKLDEATSVRLTTQAGDVSVGRLTGPAEISTAKGDIRIAEAVRGTLVLSTQMGNVAVDAGAGVSASLDAGTGYGRITNALKNDGTTELEIRATTSHGDITARSL